MFNLTKAALEDRGPDGQGESPGTILLGTTLGTNLSKYSKVMKEKGGDKLIRAGRTY